MKRIKNISKEIQEGNKTYKYAYILVKDKIKIKIDGKEVQIQSYGIKAEKRDFIEGEFIGLDKEEIFNVTPYRHKAEELIKMLSDNVVSPLHMISILGEYVDNNVSDYDEYDLNKAVINN